MSNQNSGSGGTSPEVQAMKDLASKNISGQGPAADSSTVTPAPADTASEGVTPGQVVPDGPKGGQV